MFLSSGTCSRACTNARSRYKSLSDFGFLSAQNTLRNKDTTMKSEVLVKPQPRKHFWKPEEDLILKTYVETHGERNWATVSKKSGLKRGGKSCRLRWKNYLRPDIKRGDMSQEEEDLIIRLHKLLGNRWSLIAGRLPGRTDNEVKNYWNTHLNKKCSPRGKRKAISNDSKDGQESNKKIHSGDTQVMTCFPSSTSIAETRSDVRKDGREENSSYIINSWTEEIHSFDCDLDFPIAPANSVVHGFDDEPFMNNLDSFVLLEALDLDPNLQYWAHF